MLSPIEFRKLQEEIDKRGGPEKLFQDLYQKNDQFRAVIDEGIAMVRDTVENPVENENKPGG